MKNNKEILECIDIEFFQLLQDKLASEFGIGSIITDIEGIPITKPSNFSEFCIKHTRGTEKGLKKCMTCDAYGGKKARELKKPIVYKCHAGLIDFASPIIIKGKFVGCFLCGQVLSEKPDKEKFKKIAKDIGVDEDIYLKSLENVRIVPYEEIEYAANFLYELSNKLSNFSDYQNIGMSTSKECYSSIEKLDKFINKIKSKSYFPPLTSITNLFERIYDTLFKNFNIDEEKIYQIDQNIRSLSKEAHTISERIKNTEEKYTNFNLTK